MASRLGWKSSRLLTIRRKYLGLEPVLAAFNILFLSLLCHIHNDSHEVLQNICWLVVFFPTGAFRFMKLLQYLHADGRVGIKPDQNENVDCSHHIDAFLPSFPLRNLSSCSTLQLMGVVLSQRVDPLPCWSCFLNRTTIKNVGFSSARQN